MALSSLCRRRGRMSTGGGMCRGWRLACATYVASSGLGAWRLFPNRWSLPRGLNLRPRAHRVVLIMPGRAWRHGSVSSWLLPAGSHASSCFRVARGCRLRKRPHRTSSVSVRGDWTGAWLDSRPVVDPNEHATPIPRGPCRRRERDAVATVAVVRGPSKTPISTHEYNSTANPLIVRLDVDSSFGRRHPSSPVPGPVRARPTPVSADPNGLWSRRFRLLLVDWFWRLGRRGHLVGFPLLHFRLHVVALVSRRCSVSASGLPACRHVCRGLCIDSGRGRLGVNVGRTCRHE